MTPRRATPEDAPLVARLLDAFNAEFAVWTPGPEVLAERLERLLATDELVTLLVGDEGLAVLSLRLNVWSDGPAALLDELYVVPGRRSQGLGASLLTATEDHARSCGAEELEIGVDTADYGARRFYERHGYATTGPGQTEPALYYYRSLAVPDFGDLGPGTGLKITNAGDGT